MHFNTSHVEIHSFHVSLHIAGILQRLLLLEPCSIDPNLFETVYIRQFNWVKFIWASFIWAMFMHVCQSRLSHYYRYLRHTYILMWAKMNPPMNTSATIMWAIFKWVAWIIFKISLDTFTQGPLRVYFLWCSWGREKFIGLQNSYLNRVTTQSVTIYSCRKAANVEKFTNLCVCNPCWCTHCIYFQHLIAISL